MKCVPVRAWLLTSTTTDAPPPAVARHLDRCERCRCVRNRLCRLDQTAEDPPPSVPPAARAAILAALPARQPSTKPAPNGSSVQRRFRQVAAAASLLVTLGLGFALGRITDTPATAPDSVPSAEAPSPVPMPTAPHADPLPELLDVYVNLADVYDPAVQVELLDRLAGQLRQAAVQHARVGAAEDVVLYVGLHELVVSEGLVRRAAAVAGATRPAVTAPVARGLRSAAADIETVIREVPAGIADLLSPLSHSAGDAADQIEAGNDLPISPSLPLTPTASGSLPSLTAGVVSGAVALTNEGDPLRRAVLCTTLTEQLSLATRVAAARGAKAQVAYLHKALADLLASGLAPSLLRVRVTDQGDPRLAEVSEVVSKAALTIGLLQDAARGADDPLLLARAKELEKRLKDARRSLDELTRLAKVPQPKKDSPPPRKDGPKEVRGVVQSVDPDTRTVRLKVKDHGWEVELTYRVAPDARLRIGGDDLALQEFKSGVTVKAKLQGPDLIAELRWEHPKD